MEHSTKQEKISDWATASQLAEMGFCERRLYFERQRGPRATRSRRTAQRAGIAEHDQFLRSALLEEPTVITSSRLPDAPVSNSAASILMRMLNFIRCAMRRLPGESGYDD